MSRPIPPLARAVLLLAAFLLLGLRHPGLPVTPLAIAAVALLVLYGRRARGAGDHLLARGLPWAAIAGAGLLLGAGGAARAASDCRSRLDDDARLRVEGVLEAEPGADGAASLRMEAPCRGEVRVRFRGRPPPAGVPLRGSGRWRARFDPGPWPARPGTAGTLLLDSVRRVPIARSGAHPVLRLRGAAQRRIRAIFGRRSGAVEALLLARGEALERDIRERFADAGLAHVLAISGLHVGVVAGVLLILSGALRLGKGMQSAVAAVGTLCYVLFLGAPAAAVRAALQVVLLLAGRVLQRPADPLALLAAAALVLLVADPLAVLDAGFQLSFAGAAALALLRRPILERLPDRVPAVIREGVAAGLAAGLATMPIAALRFGRAAPIGLLASVAAVPVVAVAVPASALALGVSVAGVGPGRFLAGGAGVALSALDGLARLAAAVPMGHASVTGPVAASWLVATVGGIAVLLLRPSWSRIQPLVAAASVVAVLGAWPPLATRLTAGGALQVFALDVGQGDAIAVRTPHGRWILVDAGPRSPSYDAGKRRVVPFLLKHGAQRVDLLLLTHPDADHIGGADAVLAMLRVASVLDPGVAAGKAGLLRVLEEAAARGTRWYRGVSGTAVTLDGVRLELLAPTRAAVREGSAGGGDANDYSLVFRLVYGRFTALFEGDAPISVERAVVAAAGGRLPAVLLKVGHHGSDTSTGEALLEAARPRVALISVGRHNRYGHPSAAVIRRLRERGIEIHRTDREGTVEVRAWRDGRFLVERR